jgi:hypothetical protein
MSVGNSTVKSAWIAVEVTRERAEKVLVVEAYLAVSSLEPNFCPKRYGKLVEDVRAILDRNPDIDRVSILSAQKDKACTALFRRMSESDTAARAPQPLHA